MNLAQLSIRRPTFISAVIIVIVAAGIILMNQLGVDQFPNVTFPIVTVTTPYPGAGPSEMETLVSKVLEDELSSLAGIKTLRSINKEGVSTVVAEFTLETDVKYAEQQVRDRVGGSKRKLPPDVKEPIIRRIDPGDTPIMIISLAAKLGDAALFDVANEIVKPQIEQVNQVGLVDIIGGRKREIQVQLDRSKLNRHEVAASQVSDRLAASGQNIPAGSVDEKKGETIFRTLGEFKDTKQIESTIVNFVGNDVPITIGSLGKVVDTVEDAHSRVLYNGDKSLFLLVFRQSGANTVAVADEVKRKIARINGDIKRLDGVPQLTMVRDGSKVIRDNVQDVKETIYLGIILTVLVVFFFLGNARSTLITGLALPTSLLGSFILMGVCGFTINIMTLLALSLAVGLLIDDAIVVRENIFRHNEMGKGRVQAALEGTKEVTLAVIATTLTVVAVFGPIAFLKGVVGQFFKEFGLTICFAMLVSLFDALTIAPMLSAYFAGKSGHGATKKISRNPITRMLQAFSRFQDGLERVYERVLRFTTRQPLVVLGIAVVIFIGSFAAIKAVPKTFLPAQDTGEFAIGMDMAPGTNLEEMSAVVRKADSKLRANPEVLSSLVIIGNADGEANIADFYVSLVPRKQRKVNTSEFKAVVREQMKEFAVGNPKVKDYDAIGAGMRPFNVNITGNDYDALQKYSQKVFEKLKIHPALSDVDISFRPGKPEFQVKVDQNEAQKLGVSSAMVGRELRTQVQGETPIKFRENGREYDIRVRLQDDQRNLREGFGSTYVPNINHSMIRLADVAKAIATEGPANINRQDRGRYIQISSDIAPNGPGMGKAMSDIKQIFEEGDLKLPQGMNYKFVGQAENFVELITNMAVAAVLGILFIYLVLASLYESFVTPFTIMLVLPLAACGAFYGLAIGGKSLDLFSMIGCIMLLGVATKNSILLVDYMNQLVARGVDRTTAIIEGGKTRLRPILMTSLALIAGMLPVAIGLNEASKQRTSMGVAVIGGLVSSTLLTLVVIPAAYSYIDRFRLWSRKIALKLAGDSVAAVSLETLDQAHSMAFARGGSAPEPTPALHPEGV